MASRRLWLFGLALLLCLPLIGSGQSINYYPAGGAPTTTGGSSFFAGGISLGNTLASPYANLYGDAANTLALRNGANAQTLNVYNTFTDAGNYERAEHIWSSNIYRIVTSKAGTGTTRSLWLGTDGTGRWGIEASTNAFYPLANDIYDLGYGPATMSGPRNFFVNRSTQGSKTKALTEGAATAVTQIAVPQTAGSNFADATIEWVVYASDGTDSQTLKGSSYLTAVNKAGTETCTVGAVGTAINAVSAGTLTCTASCVTGLTDVVQFALNCTSSLTQTTLNALARLDMMQPNTVTPQ
jgi:hypothetical protein